MLVWIEVGSGFKEGQLDKGTVVKNLVSLDHFRGDPLAVSFCVKRLEENGE